MTKRELKDEVPKPIVKLFSGDMDGFQRREMTKKSNNKQCIY